MLALVLLIAAVTPVESGPPLQTHPALLDAALECSGDLRRTTHNPVLLVHGTYVLPHENWGWNYLHALPHTGRDVCTVRLPHRALDDMQASAEFVVHAVRTMHRRTGRKVDIIGHSQGGLEPRWAIKYWADVRAAVGNLVTLGAPHHGTWAANVFSPVPCAYRACLQMRAGSEFITALNAGDETPGNVAYTSIYSRADHVIVPGFIHPTAVLDGARNIAVQDLCPLKPTSHVGLAFEPVVYALVLDALSHDGPANPQRVPRGLCWQSMQPHTHPFDLLRPANVARSLAAPPLFVPVLFEPDLRSYALWPAEDRCR